MQTPIERPSPPLFSVVLSIDRSTFTDGSGDVKLTMTATSHADSPVTVFMWDSIFTRYSQICGKFTCMDLDTKERVKFLTMSTPGRPPFDRRKGGIDEKGFQTFEPEEPVTFTHTFLSSAEMGVLGGLEEMSPGHRFKHDTKEGENFLYWWYGRKEDVLTPPGKSVNFSEGIGGKPITLSSTRAVEFELVADNVQ